MWLDKSSLIGGEYWRDQIRDAIFQSSLFIACFSNNYIKKIKSKGFVREELIIASAKLMASNGEVWFIPLLLDRYDLSQFELELGMVKITDLNVIDASRFGWLKKLEETVILVMSPPKYAKMEFEMQIKKHIKDKLKHIKRIHGRKDIEAIRKFLKKNTLELIFPYYFELREKAFSMNLSIHIYFCEPREDGRFILLSFSPYLDVERFLDNLMPKDHQSSNKYLDFILKHMQDLRLLPEWASRDFIHLIFMKEGVSTLFDMLYFPNFKRIYSERHLSDKSFIVMEPTSMIGPDEAQELFTRICLFDLMNLKHNDGVEKPG